MSARFRALCVLIGLCIPLAGAVAAEVKTVRAPEGAEVPETALDANGVLHVTYGRQGDAYYVRSDDGGKTFSRPVKVNQRDATVTVGGERGPKLALGKDGVVHVVWLGHYQKGGGVWYTRSADGGRTFQAERKIQDANAGCDGATVAADPAGNVFVVWLDARGPKEGTTEAALPLFMARSEDNGVRFGSNQAVKHDHPGQACACCRQEARVGANGNLYIAFRSSRQDIRDFYLLKGPKAKNEFTAEPVSPDNWKLKGCPMSGAPFCLDADGKVFIAWMSQSRVYWSVSDKKASHFAPRIATPDPQNGQNYPAIAVNPKGQVFLAWKQGQQVKWAIYAADGKPTEQQGVAATGPAVSKPSAYAGPDGNFYLVY